MAEGKIFKLKVSLLGDGAVGKTSLIKKYVYDEFDDKYLLTLGAKTTLKKIDMESVESKIPIECNLMIWDIMGQKEFERLHKTFFRGTKGAFVVTDITRRETLESVDDWITRLFDVTGPIPLVFVINKSDLLDKAEFKKEDLEAVALKYKAPVFMSSAKTGKHVDMFFYKLGQILVEKALFEKVHEYQEGQSTTPVKPDVEMDEEDEEFESDEEMDEVEEFESDEVIEEESPPIQVTKPMPGAPPAEAPSSGGPSPLVKQLQEHMKIINDQFNQLIMKIKQFEEEKAKFEKEKNDSKKDVDDSKPPIGPPKEPEPRIKPTFRTSIAWDD